MFRVGVIGGGIAGLTAAYRLKADGVEPVLFEAENRVGGVIRSERVEGFLVEHGPNSIQSDSERINGLVEELDLEDDRVQASSAARNRYIVRNGRPQAAPMSPMKLVTSDLFGPGAKLRLLREPFVPPSDPAVEESVAQFVRRRLGDEFLDYGMNPFVGGVYAGDPEQLSVRHALPAIYEMEQESGSIIRGQMDRRHGASAAAETHRMYSFRDGLEELPAKLGSLLGGAIRTGSPIREVGLRERDWKINGEAFQAVVYAAPLHRLTEIRLPAGADVSALRDVIYPPLSVVALGYRRQQVGHPLDGFGMLIPEVERMFRILGTLFTSSVFPNRAPADHVLLTSFVGGARNPSLAKKTSDQLYDLVHDDLARLLDISEAPAFRRHISWEHSIPQYNLGYGEVLDTIDRLEQKLPGLFMAGNYRSGISVGDAAVSGDEASKRCIRYIEGR